MRCFRYVIFAALLALAAVAGNVAWGDDYEAEPTDTTIQPGELFNAEELEDLLAPIALYPDPLLAQILPAATFVDQIDDAARYVRQYGESPAIDDQPWDVSVRAVAHYPDVLYMMDQKYDWTVSLGQAYVNQPEDVMAAIQRLRAEAREEGNLVSTPQQEVIVEDDEIRIVPIEPEVIYVPTYDPLEVYTEPPPPSGFISFSIGFAIGPWLNRDCDWHRHRIYYHGWRGSGWIGRARPHVNTRRSVYVGSASSVINVNRRVVQHDTTRYREAIHRNLEYRQQRGGPAPPPGIAPRAAPALRTGTPAVAPRPESTGLYRGREPRGTQPAAVTGYGGYGSGKDAAKYRERGQSSREKMRRFIRQQPAPGNVKQPATSGGRAAPPAAHSAPRPAPPASRGGGVQRPQR